MRGYFRPAKGGLYSFGILGCQLSEPRAALECIVGQVGAQQLLIGKFDRRPFKPQAHRRLTISSAKMQMRSDARRKFRLVDVGQAPHLSGDGKAP